MTKIHSSLCKTSYFYSSQPDLQSKHVIVPIVPLTYKLSDALRIVLPVSEESSGYYRELSHAESNLAACFEKIQTHTGNNSTD